ncbi:MAG: hypothetical protein Q7R93_03670 [bacterium]|nr:hypothetical protein [bacterium]
MPTFLRSINPYLKLKTEIVFHPQSGIWGLKCFYDRALRENSVEPGSPTVVQFTMPNAPVLTTEEQARFGRTQLEKFALRKQKFFQLSSGMAQQCANVEVRA